MAYYAGINLSIIALLSGLSIIEHNGKIFGHNDSTNMIMVQNLIIINIIKLKHYSNFNIVLKCRLHAEIVLMSLNNKKNLIKLMLMMAESKQVC